MLHYSADLRNEVNFIKTGADFSLSVRVVLT